MNRVDQLRDVRHRDLVGVTVERVERQRGHQRVAQRSRIRPQVIGRHVGGRGVPRAPFVDGDLHLVRRIGFGHRGPVLRDKRLHAIGAHEQVVPVVGRELHGVAIAGAAAVVVERPGEDAVERAGAARRERLEEPRRPLAIAAVGSSGDELDRDAESRHPRRVAPELGRVFFGREVAAAAPRLVADAPVADVERIAIAPPRAQIRHRRRAGGRVAVFNPLVQVARRQAAHVGGDVRRRAGQTAEVDELVRAEPIGIEALRSGGGGAILTGTRVGPEVRAARAAVGRADAVAPVVTVGEAATRPADDRRLDLLHLVDERFADAVDVGNLRVFADPDAVVHHAAEMLDEMAVQLWRDGPDRLVH